jgi:hypothetical protein
MMIARNDRVLVCGALAALVTISSVAACEAGRSSRPDGTPPAQEARRRDASPPPSRLEPPASLPGPARLVLRNLMASHAREMHDLDTAVLIVDYDRIEEDARMLAANVSIARPLSGDAAELHNFLPERFFVLQDELRARAATLSAAARSNSYTEVARTFGQLAETCVRCHAVYRQGR